MGWYSWRVRVRVRCRTRMNGRRARKESSQTFFITARASIPEASAMCVAARPIHVPPRIRVYLPTTLHHS